MEPQFGEMQRGVENKTFLECRCDGRCFFFFLMRLELCIYYTSKGKENLQVKKKGGSCYKDGHCCQDDACCQGEVGVPWDRTPGGLGKPGGNEGRLLRLRLS